MATHIQKKGNIAFVACCDIFSMWSTAPLSHCSACSLTTAWRWAPPKTTFSQIFWRGLFRYQCHHRQWYGELLAAKKIEQSSPDVDNSALSNATWACSTHAFRPSSRGSTLMVTRTRGIAVALRCSARHAPRHAQLLRRARHQQEQHDQAWFRATTGDKAHLAMAASTPSSPSARALMETCTSPPTSSPASAPASHRTQRSSTNSSR